MSKNEYTGCWYCDNILDYPGQIGLLHLGYPRCFVLIPNSEVLYYSDFESFVKTVKINWLDPSDKGTPEEQRDVLIRLWNFSIEQERKEEELYG